MSTNGETESSIELINDLEPSDDWRCLILLFPGEKPGVMGELGRKIASGWGGKVWLGGLEEAGESSYFTRTTLEDAQTEFRQTGRLAEKMIHIPYDIGKGGAEIEELVEKAGIDLVLIRNTRNATELVSQIKCDVGIVRGPTEQLDQGMAQVEINNILVPSVGGPNSISALRLLRPIAKSCDISTLYVVRDIVGENGLERGRQALADVLNLSEMDDLATPYVKRSASPINGIVEHAKENSDVVIVGATEDALSRVLYGDLVAGVVRDCNTPVVVLRRSPRGALSFVDRINYQVRRIVPHINRHSRNDTYQRIKQNSIPDVSFYVLITLSAAIAAAGLLLNSPAVVIGAMLVAPLMSPIVGVGMSMVLGEIGFLRNALTAVVRGAILAIGVGMLLGIAQLGTEQLPTEVLGRTAPSLLDLLVALFSGLAGAYALCYSQAAGALPGVAIAAALVPPLAVVGICITTGNLLLASGALLLFGTNLITISVASAIIFFLLGFRPHERSAKARQTFRQRAVRIAALLLLLNVAILGIVTYFLTAQSALEADIVAAVEFSVDNVTDSTAQLERIIQTETIQNEGGDTLQITAAVNSFEFVSHAEVLAIQEQLKLILAQQGHEFFDVGLKLQIIDFEIIDAEIPPTPTLTPTLGPSATPTQTPSPTNTASPTPRPSATQTATPLATETPVPSLTPTVTQTPQPSQTFTPEPTATVVLAQVTINNLRLRSSPSLDGDILDQLPSKSPVLMLDGLTQVDGVWWQQVNTGGQTGWVVLEFLSLSE